jgi:hypothetical protein
VVANVSIAVVYRAPSSQDGATQEEVAGRHDASLAAGAGGVDDLKRVLGLSAVLDRVDQRSDRIQELHNRPRPTVSEDQRKSVGVPGLEVDEMDTESFQARPVVSERVDLGLETAPVETVQRTCQVIDTSGRKSAGSARRRGLIERNVPVGA